MKKNALVTGGTGFVGSKLINLLLSRGYNVVQMSRSKSVTANSIPISAIYRDSNGDFLNNIDCVFHLAGIAHDISGKIPDKEYIRVNCDLTVRLAKLCLLKNIKKFVFISSVKASDHIDKDRCISECDQIYPKTPYGISKRMAEIELLKMSKNFDMNISIIRPSLVYGPGVKGNLKLMSYFIDKKLMPNFPNIANVKSMVHVDDLVRAIYMVSHSNNKKCEIFIVNDGIKYSLKNIYLDMCYSKNISPSIITIPKFFLLFLSKVPIIGFSVNKMISNECYSAEKIFNIGFVPRKTLKDINETDF